MFSVEEELPSNMLEITTWFQFTRTGL